MMKEIPQRDLRNDISSVLAKVAAGERFRITVRGRPVAELGPIGATRTFVPRETLEALIARNPLDPAFKRDMDIALGDTIDEL